MIKLLEFVVKEKGSNQKQELTALKTIAFPYPTPHEVMLRTFSTFEVQKRVSWEGTILIITLVPFMSFFALGIWYKIKRSACVLVSKKTEES